VAGEAAALGMKSGGAAVDVVIAGAARGELELAKAEAETGKKSEKLLSVSRSGHYCRL
jgi:hypothetical protein